MFERLSRQIKSKFRAKRKEKKSVKASARQVKDTIKRKLPGSRLKWWIPLVVVFPILLGIWIWKYEVFNVRIVEVSGCEYSSADELRENIGGKVLGQSIFKVSLSSIEEEIYATDNSEYIKGVYIEKYLPSRIGIMVEERKPLVCLAGKGVVDVEGVLFSEGECPWHLERFITKVEEIDLDQISAGMLIKETLVKNGHVVDEIRLEKFGGVAAKIRPGVYIKFSINSERSIENQVVLFEYVYNGLRGRRVAEIDVRFDKAVVKYAQ